MKKLHVATSPLTGTIYCGTVLKSGHTWSSNKQDVTIEALVAVAQHVINFGKPVEINLADGTPEFRITVDKAKDVENRILADIIKISAPSLDPERFEALVDAVNQVASNRNLDFRA
jgi:hypothetical protein